MTERERTCPTCGKGVLVDVSFTGGTTDPEGRPVQEPESRQVERYSCGHEVVGPPLDATAARTDELDVERRTSEDAADAP